jgi:L-alanine-DL-glutamate epimerase-like enolase superfamily enzyme
LDDHNGAQHGRAQPTKPSEDQPIDERQSRPRWHPAAQDVQLMPKNGDLSFKPPLGPQRDHEACQELQTIDHPAADYPIRGRKPLRMKFSVGTSVRLGGAEQMSMLAEFQSFLDAGAYDMMMPDVKYGGGLREMLRIAAAFERSWIVFSPHNPSGPICHPASLHLSPIAEGFTLLELQFDESPLFWSIASGDLPGPEHRSSHLSRLPGLGLRVVETAV